MSDVNEINNDNDELKKAMLFVKSQKPLDQQLQTKFQDTDKQYKAEIKPLQDEFDQKLKEYVELSDEYYNKYVSITTTENAARQATWNQQMRLYENYDYKRENTGRNQSFTNQNAWTKQSASLNTDYENAVKNYEASTDSWNNAKAARQTLISKIAEDVRTARIRGTRYAATHAPNLDETLVAEFQRRKSDLIDINNGYTKNIAQYIPWLNSQGAGHIKKVAVVGGGAKYGQSGVPYGAFWFGVVGKQNCRRNNIRAPKILVRIGNTNSAAPGSTIREREREWMHRTWGGSWKVKQGIEHKVSSTPTDRWVNIIVPPYTDALNIPIGYVEEGVGVTIDATISPYGNNNRGHTGFIGQTSLGINQTYKDRFSVSVIEGNKLSINRLDFRLNQWGQDMHLYVRRNDYGLTADTVGNVTKTSVWGSSLKWNNQSGKWKFPDNNSITLDNVPKLIWYPNADWESPCPVMNQEYNIYYLKDMSRRGTESYFVFMQVFYVDYEKIERSGENFYMFMSLMTPFIDIWLNGRKTSVPLTGDSGQRTAYTLKDHIKQGANIIIVRAKNRNGPSAFTLALCGSKKMGGDIDYGNIFVTTNEDWVVLRSDYKCETTFTDHRGRGVSGFNPLFQDDTWMQRMVTSMQDAGYFKKNEGVRGVKTHNYKPPNAKVKYVRIKFAMRPVSQPFLQISQIAVYPVDNMNKNVAQGMPTSACCDVYPNSGANPSNAVDGTLSARPHPNIFHSGSLGGWDKQFFEITLLNPETIYKIDFFGRSDCCQDRARQLCIELYDENRISIFLGPPFESDALHQQFYFNNPIVPSNSTPMPTTPIKGVMTKPYPATYVPGVLPAYPVMPGFNTPDQELLNKLISKSGDLITLNLRIQDIYKKYSMDGTITQYQSSVLDRRRNLVNQVMGMIKERNTLTARVNEYNTLAKNHYNQEARAFSNHTYFWAWCVFTVLTVAIFVIYNFFPNLMSNTPNIVSWAIIILTTLIMTMFIGGSITFMLWLIILVSIFFYILTTKYGGYVS